MADLLRDGAAWLAAQRHAHMTTTVKYTRGENSVNLLATIGQTELEQTDDYGLILRLDLRDYLVQAFDLVLAGVVTLPVEGDRVRETEDSTVYTYEVMAPGREPPYRYSDPYRRTLRIHTKLVGTEAI